MFGTITEDGMRFANLRLLTTIFMFINHGTCHSFTYGCEQNFTSFYLACKVNTIEDTDTVRHGFY